MNATAYILIYVLGALITWVVYVWVTEDPYLALWASSIWPISAIVLLIVATGAIAEIILRIKRGLR